MLRTSLLMVALLTVSFARLHAADEAPKADAPKAETPTSPAATAPATTTKDLPAAKDAPPAAAPPVAAAPAAPSQAETDAMAKFDAAMADWKKLMEEMKTTQLAYKSAKPSERQEFRHKFEGLVAQGEQLRPKLSQAAEAAYTAAPNKNTLVSDTILSLIAQELRDEQYADALKLSRLLILHKYPNARVYDLAGVAAFQLDDFEGAKEFLEQAESNSALSVTGRDMSAAVANPVSIVRRDLDEDRYEQALRRAKALLDRGMTTPELYNLAGIAAYQATDFDAAEKYLATAKEKNSLDPKSFQLLEDMPESKKRWDKEKVQREADAKANDLPRVEIKTTKGTVVLELFENEAPNTVANFIKLIDKGFYNNTTFHRVLGGFMAQGGDPQGTGMGGPGYTIECECYAPNARNHFRGTLSMAHAGRDTGGSQFFLTFVRTPQLDGKHTVFGRVVEGMDVLAKLQRRSPDDQSGRQPPGDRIIEAKVLRKRDHKYEPKTIADKPGL